MTKRTLDLVRRQRTEFFHAMAAKADRWVAACGGTETPFYTRSGRQLLYVYNPQLEQHAYLDVVADLILSDESVLAYLQV